ncbi:protein APEM9-like isoform X2 [Cucurbita moschata]|uniref:Protein APEM9-like isoform X1 n=1 Tax=Cucurbita moschata TaxID=3662 RepID=A0A6J1FB87_CUCMO|nr:protein APEM9-like isoform X1 [Cucurbita moschata]XP_022935650.1 protein APEM9-like isoform X2 [Cucurbita moschata]
MDDGEAIWEDIERSESYLVCSMYEEALGLASSVLKRISQENNGCENDLLEAAGMVLVQSLKELGRTSHMVDELKVSFTSVTAIPVNVLLTGACLQISEGLSDMRCFLEEFLSKWSLLNEEIYVLAGARNIDDREHYDDHAQLTVDEYLQVVEVYLQTLMEIGLKDVDLAVSWVEKAALPEEKRQVLLRRLDYQQSLKAASLSQSSPSSLHKDDHKAHLSSSEDRQESRASKTALDPGYHPDGGNANRETVLKLHKLTKPWFWPFRTITLKFGSTRLIISTRRVLLSCLFVLIYYLLRRKLTTLKRMAQKQALSAKKAMVDLWQLAFSYQVNPLAIAQPLSGVPRGAS